MTTRRSAPISDKASKILAATLIIGVAFFVAYTNGERDRNLDEATKSNLKLKLKIASHEAINDSLQEAISAYEDTINDLRVSKSKITARYEKRIKDFNNSTLVDDDSITRYISDKIHYKN